LILICIVSNTTMLSNAIKLLFLAMALVCVAARPEFEVPETESYEMENDEMDREPRLKIPAPILTKPLSVSKMAVSSCKSSKISCQDWG
jgi:hypothetical protein